jgi:hypothetical protein
MGKTGLNRGEKEVTTVKKRTTVYCVDGCGYGLVLNLEAITGDDRSKDSR